MIYFSFTANIIQDVQYLFKMSLFIKDAIKKGTVTIQELFPRRFTGSKVPGSCHRGFHLRKWEIKFVLS